MRWNPDTQRWFTYCSPWCQQAPLYLQTAGALLYCATSARPDIAPSIATLAPRADHPDPCDADERADSPGPCRHPLTDDLWRRRCVECGGFYCHWCARSDVWQPFCTCEPEIGSECIPCDEEDQGSASFLRVGGVSRQAAGAPDVL